MSFGLVLCWSLGSGSSAWAWAWPADGEVLRGFSVSGDAYAAGQHRGIDVAVEGSNVHVTYSLTSMGCPVGPMIEQQITETVAEMDGVENVESELTWDPPWSPEKMSDDAKFVLGFA